MRFSILGMSALALAAVSAPAFAQDEPASDITVTGSATVVTDYRFRGISQSYKQFALQGGFSVAHSSGFYVGTWGSSIDDYVAYGSDQEIDFFGGYSTTVGAATVDVGVLYYYYPGSGGYNTDFFEPYASVKGTFGPVSVKVGATYAPKQSALDYGFGKETGFYGYGDVSGALGPVTLTGHLGHSFSRNVATFGTKYTDWSIGATYTLNSLTFGVSYVDTNKDFYVGSRNVSKAGVVGSIGVSF